MGGEGVWAGGVEVVGGGVDGVGDGGDLGELAGEGGKAEGARVAMPSMEVSMPVKKLDWVVRLGLCTRAFSPSGDWLDAFDPRGRCPGPVMGRAVGAGSWAEVRLAEAGGREAGCGQNTRGPSRLGAAGPSPLRFRMNVNFACAAFRSRDHF